MEKPRKKLSVQHMPSQLLSQEANAKFFALLEARTQALCTAFVSVVMSKPPERPEWKPFRTGVATLIKDHTRKSYYIQIYDLVDWAKAREEELKKGTTYHVSLPTFHQLETSTGKAMGLKFSLEKEAKMFAQIARDITMTGHYKSDSSYSLTLNTNDKISAGDVSEDRRTTTSTPRPPPPPAKKTSTLSRPPRPKSMHRESPKSPPPPPPPSLNSRNPVAPVPSNASSLPSPPTPPPPRAAPCPQSSPSTPVNKDAPALIAGTLLPPQSSVPSSAGPTATLDRKKLPKKITKDMIGVPTNFQHVNHVGFDPDFGFGSKIQEIFQMGEPARRTNATRPPPSGPPPPPGNRNPVPSPASEASPPKPDEAVSIVSADEPSREKEHASVCEEPRAGALEALPTSATTPSATQVNDAIHCDTELKEVAVKDTGDRNESDTQTILLLEESVHKAALETFDESRNAHVVETVDSTSGNDALTECNSDFEIIENSRNSDPVQSVMQPSDVAMAVDPIPNSTTTSLDSSQLPEADMTLNDNLVVKSDSPLVGSDQECRKNENDTENESDKHNAEILESLNELEAMLEGVSISSSESAPSQTTAEKEIHDRVTHSASEDAGGEEANEDIIETSDEAQSSCEFLDGQTNISSASVLTYDPDEVSHESFDPLEMNKMLGGATIHSNFIFSAETLQIPVAPTRYRRKKSKQEPSPPPPPPTPTEADQNDSEYL